MNNLYLLINKVQSHVITWGSPCKSKDVIICISGNPGITDFYTEFGTELHKNTNIPVCVIGHAGHEEVPDYQSNVLNGKEHLFNLDGQIEHKLDFINSHIDKDSKLHLIGHSIGSWMILKMIEKNKSLIPRISSVNLLFPTIQNMAETKNGIFLNYVVRRLHVLLMFLFYMTILIPDSVKKAIIRIYLKIVSLPQSNSEKIIKLCRPRVGEKVLLLAYDEMDTVRELNIEILEIIKCRTNVLYGPRDAWAPLSYMEDLKQFRPHLKMNEVDAEHAFVLTSSCEIADIVSVFLLENINNSENKIGYK